MTTNKEISKEVAGEELAQLITHVTRGGQQALDQIREALNSELLCVARNGEATRSLPHREVGRAQLKTWLHSDPQKRIEPTFGVGVLLMRVWQREAERIERGYTIEPKSKSKHK